MRQFQRTPSTAAGAPASRLRQQAVRANRRKTGGTIARAVITAMVAVNRKVAITATAATPASLMTVAATGAIPAMAATVMARATVTLPIAVIRDRAMADTVMLRWVMRPSEAMDRLAMPAGHTGVFMHLRWLSLLQPIGDGA